MKNPSFAKRSYSAGFAATLIWTVLMYLGPAIGLHQIDIAGILGSLTIGGPVFAFSLIWWFGLVLHFTIASLLFPFVYARFVYFRLPGSPWMRGLQWGLFLWVGSMLFFMPIVGAGVFAMSLPSAGLLIFSSLIQHMIYGAAFGALAGRASEEDWRRQPRFASMGETAGAPRSIGFVR